MPDFVILSVSEESILFGIGDERTMKTIEIQLDNQTIEHALQIAKNRNSSLEDLIKEIIKNIEFFESKKSIIMGMFSDEPELVDQIVESAMAAREKQSLRQANE